MDDERRDVGSTVDDLAREAGGTPPAAGGPGGLGGGEVADAPGNPGADDQVGAGGHGAGATGPEGTGEPGGTGLFGEGTGDAANAGDRDLASRRGTSGDAGR